MERVDLKRTLDGFRARSGEFRMLTVPPRTVLAIDGRGDPNTAPAFADALAALYPAAYRLKFASRAELGRDYVVPPLEGLWSADDLAAFTTARDASRWEWTLLLMVPDWVPRRLAEEAVASAAGAAASYPALVDPAVAGPAAASPAAASPAVAGPAAASPAVVRVETLDEGLCVQTLHVGPFADEGETLARLHSEFLPSEGLRMTGRHHEIYLSDRRRVAPERMRTILRQPVTR